MKNVYNFYAVCLLSTCFLVGCTNEKQQTESQKPTSDSLKNRGGAIVIGNQSELLKTIIGKPSQYLFRGLDLGDKLEKIKLTETFDIFEDSTDHIGYTFETENFETIDIQYYLDNNKAISKIRVDVYLNSLAESKSLWTQLDNYLSSRSIPIERANKAILWEIENKTLIQLQDVSKNKDYGLRLLIGFPKENNGQKTI